MKSLLRRIAVGFVALALPATASMAQTESADTDGIRYFEPQYYTEFDPRSALELVSRTPGFNPQESSGGRGLADVRSNILINGERPPPKGQSIRQQLREMPVATVVRIELIDAGARLDIDMQGYPQVVNVVTLENAPAYYEVTTQINKSGDGDVLQRNERRIEVDATGSFSWRGHEFTLSGDTRDRSQRSPSGIVEIDPANPEQRVTSLNTQEQQNAGFEFSALLNLPEDSTLSVTSQFNDFDNQSAPTSLTNDPDAIRQTNDYTNDSRDFSTEYRRPFCNNSELNVALVDAYSKNHSESSLTDGGLVRTSVNDQETGETAARLLIERSPSEHITIRTTATAAYNYFDGGFRITENGVEVPIQGSENHVEEDRYSVAGVVDWNLSDRWTVQGGLGAESYNISSRDASSGTQTDPTGNFSVLFRPQPRTTFTLESTRNIGQLSFNQFLASSNLSSEIRSAGASELEPQRSRRHSAIYDRRFGDRGVLRLELRRNEAENPVRSVALTDELIVSQNSFSQRTDQFLTSIEFPFEQFGREDLVLGFSGSVRQSRTIDPITLETREGSGITKRNWSFQIRRDPGEGKLSWSFSVGDQTRGLNYSVRTTSLFDSNRSWGGQIAYEPIQGLKFTTGMNGPSTEYYWSNFYPAVREIGLDPSFTASAITRSDRQVFFSIEWRRLDHFEVRATFNTQPRVNTVESLVPFGGDIGTMIESEIARTPIAQLRFRYYR